MSAAFVVQISISPIGPTTTGFDVTTVMSSQRKPAHITGE